MAEKKKSLHSVDFASMIGGSLVAVIQAQSQAAQATLNFIKNVGFEGNRTASIPFQYKKMIPQPDGTTTAQSFEVSVPILSLLPVPFVRVQEAEIEFRAKVVGLFSGAQQSGDESLAPSKDPGQNSGSRVQPAEMRVSFSNRQRSKLGSDTSSSYSMHIRLRAVQDDVPTGLERLLAKLEATMDEQPQAPVKPGMEGEVKKPEQGT